MDSFTFSAASGTDDLLAAIRQTLAPSGEGYCVVTNDFLDPEAFLYFLHQRLAPSLSLSRRGNRIITYDEVRDRGDRMDRAGALLSASNQGFPLHTDCSFLDRPADLVALYCVENAASGGESVLLHADRLIASLPQPYVQQLLTRTFPFYSKEYPILEETDGRYLIRFHEGELLASCDPLRRETLTRELRPLLDVLATPAHCTTVKLQPHQCLLLNNRTCLHGRLGFEAGSKRIFYRSRHYLMAGEMMQ